MKTGNFIIFMRILLFLAVLVAGSAQGYAQDLSSYEPILLPLSSNGLPGAYGTEWIAGAAVMNNSGDTVRGLARVSCPFECGADLLLQPYDFSYLNLQSTPPGRPAQIVYFERGKSNDLTFNLWVGRRIPTPAGPATLVESAVPVVRENDFFDASFGIPGIRIDSNSRYRLRVYGRGGEGGTVRIRVMGMYSSQLLDEFEVNLLRTDDPYSPSYIEIVLDELIARERPPFMTVELQPLTGELSIWALLSDTSNTSQRTVLYFPK